MSAASRVPTESTSGGMAATRPTEVTASSTPMACAGSARNRYWPRTGYKHVPRSPNDPNPNPDPAIRIPPGTKPPAEVGKPCAANKCEDAKDAI